MRKKAAFVILVLVILALCLYLYGPGLVLMEGIEDLTQEAQSDLRDAFKETEANFAVRPSTHEIEKGKGLRLSAGIENDAPDGKDHYFVINVLPASVSAGVLSFYGCANFEVCTRLQGEMEGWLTFDTAITPIKAGTAGFKHIDITIPSDVKEGSYLFNVVACYDGGVPDHTATPPSAQCDPKTTSSEKLWGTPQPVIVRVK